METKNFLVILLSVIFVFALISIIGSVITGYVIHGELSTVFSNSALTITIVFSVVLLISIIILRKTKITNA